MTLTNMPAHGNQLVAELPTSGGQADRIVIYRLNESFLHRFLNIAFKRTYRVSTCRVSGNDSINDLPPDVGNFPLYKVSDYKNTLPSEMAAKGGYFLPMYRREAT